VAPWNAKGPSLYPDHMEKGEREGEDADGGVIRGRISLGPSSRSAGVFRREKSAIFSLRGEGGEREIALLQKGKKRKVGRGFKRDGARGNCSPPTRGKGCAAPAEKREKAGVDPGSDKVEFPGRGKKKRGYVV